MTVQVIPFDVAHFDTLDLREDPGVSDFFKVENRGFYLAQAAKHPAYTLMVDGRPVACAGVVILWPGVGEGWAFIGKDISRVKWSFVREAWRRLAEVQMRYGLHRLQATVHEKHRLGHAFLTYLGFFPEGKLHEYGADQSDYIMYMRRR